VLGRSLIADCPGLEPPVAHVQSARTVAASPDASPGRAPALASTHWLRGAAALLLLYTFLVGVRGLGGGFKLLGTGLVEQFFAATANPFVGLALGILATAIVQSSSVTTSMIVALVAAPDDPLPIANAVPMVMGANIGTTVTATLVSLGHVGNRIEFRRAFAAATCHDFFNLLTVAVLLPLELLTGYLKSLSGAITSLIPQGVGGELPDPIKAACSVVLEPLRDEVMAWAPTQSRGALLIVLLAAAMIFGSLVGLVKTLRALARGRLEQCVAGALDEKPVTGMAVGCVTTAMVQSSSITTSLLVPFAGTGIVKLEQAFPIILGANVGTTVTALIASMGAPSQTFHLAVQISLVHLLFNLSGILLIYPVRFCRQVPLKMARWLAGVAVQSKLAAVAFILLTFFVLPAALTAAYQFWH
jgi:sodium-dependent phosphate cotransporter